MSESESEDEILERIETALKKIAGLASAPRPAGGAEIDRAALAESLDAVIARLRAALEIPGGADQTTE